MTEDFCREHRLLGRCEKACQGSLGVKWLKTVSCFVARVKGKSDYDALWHNKLGGTAEVDPFVLVGRRVFIF